MGRDLRRGNVTTGDPGAAHLERVGAHLAREGERSIVGRAVVVHAGRDELTSQPSGDAGGRVACGVIQRTAALARSGVGEGGQAGAP